ncbi:hypothetical protein KUTeg_001870 [Tegillarca granosa]|uniref:Uncharacterized protein n=1 Tax=Tegillarca granosa TaxID=220873 RepID=A0ABQ9FSP6_TEGGR|nr:hypothetical protein KUTeg_001870 [Tegillarca granosa]
MPEVKTITLPGNMPVQVKCVLNEKHFVLWIFGSWASWNKLKGNDDDDWVDRVNHLYTVVRAVYFAVFTGGGQYVGNPIECWCPCAVYGLLCPRIRNPTAGLKIRTISQWEMSFQSSMKREIPKSLHTTSGYR